MKIIIFLLIIGKLCQKVLIQALSHDSFTKVLWGSYTNVRISQLLNQLCNESQNEEILSRDACYGCFFRASNKPSGYPMLLSMSACAELYLDNSSYGHCQTYLKNAVANAELNASPAVIYCTFLECIRQVNKDCLIKSCIAEVIESFDNFTASDTKLAQLYVNTTACILAKTRCGSLNPITGALKEGNTSTKFSIIPTMNAILVNTNYDINIIQMPFGHGVIDECAKYRNIQQATWPSVQC
ncbi:uncharacterized protein LOC130670898 isoform X1 [Microplitis mediator]|uniref:uncharacterized protein LOC130670898 isoform X1 n=2 Tax=Microplitis mediator TaxID=375433 RepID=UPI00255277B5|nr:uncharacterized protein LOC130670898 isoform X1 [Microplitis mediator]